MDSADQTATILALEAATEALMAALRRKPDADLEGAAVALKAREAAMRLLVGSDPAARPPDMNARLRRILGTDLEAADQLRAEMASLRDRLAGTRQMMDDYRARNRPSNTGS